MLKQEEVQKVFIAKTNLSGTTGDMPLNAKSFSGFPGAFFGATRPLVFLARESTKR